jgi:glycosyltransferase involved in cell wall biosynthesis
MKTIALCIPAYNAAWCLPRLLDSALKQLIPFDEILVYDDCSTDNTKEVAKRFGATVIEGDINRGCSYGKNKLAALSDAHWLHFHDADDELMPNFTTLAHRWIEKEKCPDVILFDYQYKDDLTKQVIDIRKFDSQALNEDPIAYTLSEQINPFCGLYRRKRFLEAGGYDCDPLVLFNEDCAFHISLAMYGLSFDSEQELSIINYFVPNSMSQRNLHQCAVARFHVLNNAAKKLNSRYHPIIIDQLYRCISNLSSFQDWKNINKALDLCRKLGQYYSSNGSPAFNFMTKMSPIFTVWVREKIIRLFKPHLRKNA